MHDHDSVEKFRLRVLVHHFVEHLVRHAEELQPGTANSPFAGPVNVVYWDDHIPSPFSAQLPEEPGRAAELTRPLSRDHSRPPPSARTAAPPARGRRSPPTRGPYAGRRARAVRDRRQPAQAVEAVAVVHERLRPHRQRRAADLAYARWNVVVSGSSRSSRKASRIKRTSAATVTPKSLSKPASSDRNSSSTSRRVPPGSQRRVPSSQHSCGERL